MVGAVLIVGVAGCSPIPRVSAADARRAGSTVAVLSEGRSHYLASCSGCHVLTPPGRFTARDWEGYMETMAPVSSLNDEEKSSILKYLKTFAKPATK